MNKLHYYKLYRWSNGLVVDTFEGDLKECMEYARKWRNYLIDWQML